MSDVIFFLYLIELEDTDVDEMACTRGLRGRLDFLFNTPAETIIGMSN